MTAHRRVFAFVAGALSLALSTMALPSAAQAGEKGGGGHGCCKPKPPCCAPHRPDVKVPGVTVYPPKVVIMPPSLNVNINANASAKAYATASASATASNVNNITFFGGGGGGFASPGVATGIASLNVVGLESRKVPFQASRTQIKTVVIRAVCIDDRLIPHPASQVFPGQDVADHYEGELYRCIAGSRLQITLGQWLGKASFDGGENLECRKGEALWFKGGEISCRPQKPARDCNERSLLRRYGVGMKVFKMVRVETYTAYREETVQSASTGGIVLDGGVGGYVF
jgi:hypothetical protein